MHPSFINLITQLSPKEVELLKFIHDSCSVNGISAVKDGKKYRLIETSLIRSLDDVEKYSMYIENLCRLELIHVDRYDEMILLEENEGYNIVSSKEPLAKSSKMYALLHEDYELYCVNAYLIVLGENFLEACID